MISFSGVYKSYQQTEVLRSTDATIKTGDKCVITGVGKSTVLGLCCGTVEQNSGLVSVMGEEIKGSSRSTLAGLRRHMGIAVCQTELLSQRSVYDNLRFSLYLQGTTGSKARKQVVAVLDALGIADVIDKTICEVSSSERKLIVLAKAFVADPEILVLDDITDQVRLSQWALLRRYLEDLDTTDTTVVASTEDPEFLDFARRLGWRVFQITNGQLIEEPVEDRRLQPQEIADTERMVFANDLLVSPPSAGPMVGEQ